MYEWQGSFFRLSVTMLRTISENISVVIDVTEDGVYTEGYAESKFGPNRSM
jgi:hypothetical protein